MRFYIRAWKHYMYWLNFMIIVQVTSEVLQFFSPKEILLDINTFLISTSFKNIGFSWR